MKKIVLSLMVVVMMFVFCGISFGEWDGYDTSNLIICDDSDTNYTYNENNQPIGTFYGKAFSVDATGLNNTIYKNSPTNISGYFQFFYPYISYQDTLLKKLIPYLIVNRSDNSNIYPNWDYSSYIYEWGSWDTYHQYYKEGATEATSITPIEAYEIGVFEQTSDQVGIIRAFTWLDDASVLHSKFGFTKAPIEYYYGPYSSGQEESYNQITDNPNYIWAMFAHKNLKVAIDSINSDSEAKGFGKRIQVLHYISAKPTFTFLD